MSAPALCARDRANRKPERVMTDRNEELYAQRAAKIERLRARAAVFSYPRTAQVDEQ